MATDENTDKSLRDLTASVQDLCNTLSSERSSPGKSRADARAKDEVTTTIYEQIRQGKAEQTPDWAEVELMSEDEIEAENK
jgi:uncharacterized protein (DUF342 family)